MFLRIQWKNNIKITLEILPEGPFSNCSEPFKHAILHSFLHISATKMIFLSSTSFYASCFMNVIWTCAWYMVFMCTMDRATTEFYFADQYWTQTRSRTVNIKMILTKQIGCYLCAVCVPWLGRESPLSCTFAHLAFLFVFLSADHPQLHAQIPATGPHHQEERPHGLAAQPQVWRVSYVRVRWDRLHGCHSLSEPAGEWLAADVR